jgi:HPt (histidine-containing phosphotransfer) domain-containing protein
MEQLATMLTQTAATATANTDATRELLIRLWERSLPIVRERLDVLDNAASAASNNTLTDDLRAHAIAEAHKLAGSLGMFGYSDGTEFAREIEALLEAPGTPPAGRLVTLATRLRATLFPTA